MAAQFNNNRGVWRDTALFWAQQFAEAPGKQNDSFTEAFKKLCSMGFDKQKSLASLSQETFITLLHYMGRKNKRFLNFSDPNIFF